MKLKLFGIVVLIFISSIASGETQNPIEVGDVRWGRDFNAALQTSAKTGKPVLILFQEVPG